MGIIGNLLRVTNSELEDYKKDSSLLINRIFKTNSENEKNGLVDLDKTWDGIIFLLTGQNSERSNHPLLKVLFSGQYVDPEQDMGDGPAHYLTPAQVADLNAQISKITIADLRLKYDPEKMDMMGIYPSIWDEGGDAFDYIADGFSTLQKVFQEATANNEAIISFVC
ncbi:MAG: YfbM family protein [Saprospiraceae bacterium]|nr:YfbM family protein [Saprospiraceae bacterium]